MMNEGMNEDQVDEKQQGRGGRMFHWILVRDLGLTSYTLRHVVLIHSFIQDVGIIPSNRHGTVSERVYIRYLSVRYQYLP